MERLMFNEWEPLFHRPINQQNGSTTYAGAPIESLTNLWWSFPNKVMYRSDQSFNKFTRPLIEKDPSLVEVLKKNNFVNPDGKIKWVSYAFNNYGFRSDSWLDNEKGAIFLGCSDTYGVGNYLEDLWAHRVANHLGVKMFNMGIPGGGVDQAYRVLKSHISTINADYVFLLTPEITRRELFKDGYPLLINVNALDTHLAEDFKNEKKLLDELRSVYHKLYLQHHNSFINTSMAIDAIKYLCEKYNKKFIELKNPPYYPDETSAAFEEEYKNNTSVALDLTHRGRTFQHLLAKYFIKKL